MVSGICRAVAIALLIVGSSLPVPAGYAEKIPVITVHARQYAFAPSDITLYRGESVQLKLISDDIDHGLAVRELGIHADMPKHKPVLVSVTPLQAGDFSGTCSRFCGAGHGSMRLTVHVVDKH